MAVLGHEPIELYNVTSVTLYNSMHEPDWTPNFGNRYHLGGGRLIVIFRKVYISRVRKYVIALRHLQLSLGIHGNA